MDLDNLTLTQLKQLRSLIDEKITYQTELEKIVDSLKICRIFVLESHKTYTIPPVGFEVSLTETTIDLLVDIPNYIDEQCSKEMLVLSNDVKSFKYLYEMGSFSDLLNTNNLLPLSHTGIKYELTESLRGRAKLTLYYCNISDNDFGVGYDLDHKLFVLFGKYRGKIIIYQSSSLIHDSYTHNPEKIQRRMARFWRKDHSIQKRYVRFSGCTFYPSHDLTLSDHVIDLTYIL